MKSMTPTRVEPNEEQPRCTLCGSLDTHVEDWLSVALLARRYRKIFGMNIDTCGASKIALRVCTNCGLKFFTPRLNDDEAFYASLQKFPFYYLTDKDEYQKAKKYVRPTDYVLEIGSGWGAFSKLIQCNSYTGLEYNTPAITAASEMGITLINDTVERHAKTHADRYDVVCSFQVLEHVSDVGGVLSAAVHCTKPGGKIIMSIPSEDSFMGIDVNNVLNMPPHHATRWTDACLTNVAGMFNLTLIALEHDRLADMHLVDYCECFMRNVIRDTLRMKRRVLDPRFSRLPTRWLIARTARFLAKGLRAQEMRPYGHSVTAIYEKVS